jgi:hypothetical protein
MAKALALTGLDVLADDALAAAVKDEFSAALAERSAS